MAQPILQVSSLGDLGQSTLPELNRLQLTDISAELQDYIVMGDLLVKGGTLTTAGSGKSFQWDVMVNDSGAAANVGLGYQDSTSIVDTLTQATADWRHSKTDWAMIGQEEQMNASPAKIVDLRMVREKASMISLVKLLEANFFGPPVSSTDFITPWGIKTWFPKTSTEGFTVTMPSSYTTLGLSTTTYPQWKAYGFPYTTVDDTDFVRKVNKAFEFTNWKPPVDGLPTLSRGSKYRLFSNYGLIGPLQELLKASNDNLGMDIGKYAGSVVINRIPLARVPYLEADTTNPIYGLCIGDLKIYRLKGWWMRRTSVPMVPGHHTVSADYLDCTYQFVMTNRRTSFVGSTATTEPA